MSEALELALVVPGGSFAIEVDWRTSTRALGLFGPSGSGKTSVLEALAGLRPEARGRIAFGGAVWLDSARGVRLPPEARGVGYVPQEALLFPHLDVLGNVRIGERRASGSPRRLQPERVLSVLELEPLARRPVATLSGGERRRVALARALCSAPALLLLDEPLAGLEAPLRRRVLEYLLRVRDEFAIPTLHVSHDSSESALLGREIAVLDRGQVVARGAPEEVFGGLALAREDGVVAVVNLLEGRVESIAESLATVELEPGLRIAVADDGSYEPGQRVTLELRGADVLVARGPAARISAQNALPASVRELHLPRAGDRRSPALVTAVVGAAARPLTVVVSQRACRELELAAGVDIRLVFKAQACRPLAAESNR